MIIAKDLGSLSKAIQLLNGKSIGFVPTMGALHSGHISLIEKAKQENEAVVCSIFVNPTQFNNSTDFEKYPITTEKDIELLSVNGCNILFLPSVTEIYPKNEVVKSYNFAILENILEGEFRSGHFKGVGMVVARLFELIPAKNAYFGLKDYQQCMVIQSLVKQINSSIHLVFCETIRELDGLAMSSRNARLNTEERKIAVEISKMLFWAKKNFNALTNNDILTKIKEHLNSFELIKIEYVELRNSVDLNPISNSDKSNIVLLIAAFVGEIRLIDNLILDEKSN